MWALMDKLGLPDDQPIENGIISKSIESAQSKIEGHNFDIRKQILEYDDVVNKQREVIYGHRRKVLKKKEIRTEIADILKDEVENISVCSHFRRIGRKMEYPRNSRRDRGSNGETRGA